MSESFVPEPYSAEFVDTDGDGYQETTLLDSDGDAVVDTALVDVDGDGTDDLAAFDNRADGEFVPDVVAVDLDGDGYADHVADDTDFDGVFDSFTQPEGVGLAEANPYGGGGHDAEPYGADVVADSTTSGGGTEEGTVIAGEGGDALYVDPDGSVTFSGSDVAGTDYSYGS
ncbi:hypothetical protein [Pseudonocardia broussonetiae]|uniref:Uncharacterized protein n=1 Tax=Pseudonocardia broussonetiae TaxID=2736640 RepID=A0A6M6JP27_9PSEU|nr:hypothetical protein [Pseudonocardia broussonetiae]QJY48199.1 hypothetical protein HOP40_22335 [Pseudonocardia broussonetiae]